MVIKRDLYVKKLLSKRWNGKVKIITGIRRCGKAKVFEWTAQERNIKDIVDRYHLKEMRYRNP